MYVKQITICGFKSYRENVAAGPFCGGHNVVVGRNGSGKSNFFDAVRFVLSDTFANLRAEDRIALLHEGAGASVLSAYVEIIFDNADQRLPFDKDEVALRRMIGLKKDEYVLDRRNVSRTEVFNILESAGFSRANPYYIVQQGKVAALVAMTDSQRLDLLKEVAGTRVYDERRNESLKIMEDTDGKREKINEVVQYIEERLQELESEMEELKQFQSHDKRRRAIEYTIYVKELEETKMKLESLESERSEKHDRGAELDHLQRDNEVLLQEAEKKREHLESVLRRLRDDLTHLQKSRRADVETMAKLRVDVQEAEDAAESGKSIRERAEADLAVVRLAIADRKTKLEPLIPLYNEANAREEACARELKRAEKRVLDLRVKSGRGAQFSTQEERDSHLQSKIMEGNALLEETRRQYNGVKQEALNVGQSVARSSEELQQKKEASEELRSIHQSTSSELTALRVKRDGLLSKRQELWRKDSELESRLSELASEVDRQERALRAAIGSGAFVAIESVKKAAMEDTGLGKGLYGPLFDIISVSSKFATAVDTAAASSLTHVVVDTDQTAADFVNVLQRRKAGRVTFIPLNKLEQQQRPPLPVSQDAIALISKVKCNDTVFPAVEQIFGGFMIARSVDVATQLSRQSNVDCVTLDGDLVNRRGAMSGGFVDARRSRIESSAELRRLREERLKHEGDLKAAKQEIQVVEAELSNVLAEILQKENGLRSTNAQLARISTEHETAEAAKTRDEKRLKSIDLRLKSLEQSIADSETEIGDMQVELATPLTFEMLPEEAEELSLLSSRLEDLKTQAIAASREQGHLRVQVEKITEDLETNLERQAAELEKTIRASSMVAEDPLRDAQARLTTKKAELEEVSSKVASFDAEIEQRDEEQKEAEAELRQQKVAIEECRAQDARIAKDIADEQEQMETLFNRRALHTQTKEEAEKKIRELGSLPEDFAKYRNSSNETLMRKLGQTNEKLKSYSHVNKKALDQYINFTEQRDTLQKRRTEVDSGANAIRQLIDQLDTRKDEDIMRTFKGVSKHFSDVFAELVPGGKASLIMQRGEDTEQGRLSYTGVSMKVSFTGSGDSYLINQLSGGQKSIVALTLIFAIQRLDPAPFYLFDEIDANLDATHRQAVATLIQKQSKQQTQFITTTFRPEFVNAAEKLFGVTHKNKISAVNEINREEALTFITDVPAR